MNSQRSRPMKTINCNSCRAKIRKECEEDFLKHEYSIYQDLAFTFCCFSTAAVLMAHAQKGRSKKYIQALFNHLCIRVGKAIKDQRIHICITKHISKIRLHFAIAATSETEQLNTCISHELHRIAHSSPACADTMSEA